jgi:prepilin-type N-terminal cleavage/methylation domain-containing protein
MRSQPTDNHAGQWMLLAPQADNKPQSAPPPGSVSLRKMTIHTDDRDKHRGMTLIEVMLGLSLLVLISGGVIAVVQSALTSTRIAHKEFVEDEEISMLFAYFRALFLDLPATIELSTPEQLPESTYQQLQFQNAPELFSWGKGREGPPDTQVLLTTRDLNNGNFCLILEKQLQHPSQSLIRKELVLLNNLTFLEWSFLDQNGTQWTSSWHDLKRRPAAIRLRLQREDDPQPLQATFAMSPVVPKRLSL